MANKHPKDYSVDEVCVWLNAVGFGDKAPAFRESTIDGSFLCTLGIDDFKELGLTSLQGKRLLHELQQSNDFADAGGIDRIKQLEAENAELRAQLKSGSSSSSPPPTHVATAPAPPPPPTHVAPASSPAPPPPPKSNSPPPPQSHHKSPGMVQEGAKGAVRGAVIGAVGGAIMGDPAQGAKMGAAMGGTHGAMKGLGHRLRDR